ncbi:MAG: phosphatase PAP2 family protein [Gemmatimonadetes bacterium]|nr:phosphatase PAP2 family protein [Gemmatimonadota bacterium]
MRTLLVLLCAALLGGTAPLSAQVQGAAPDTVHKNPRFFTRTDALYAGGFVLGTLAMTPLDRTLAEHLQDSTVQANRFFRHSANGVQTLGNPVDYIVSGGLYAVGKVTGNRPMAEAGLHTTEAIFLTDMLTVGVKDLAGRARPLVDVHDPHDFKLGRGFGNDSFQSFPSGHTSSAFAAASAFTAEVGRWHPNLKLPAGIVLYTAASLVGVSRMYNNKHWASDVLGGAALGTFTGWKVVQYNHAHPDNFLDRVFLGAGMAPAGNGGALIYWSLPSH